MVYLYTETENLYNEICEEIRMFIDCNKIIKADADYISSDKNDLFFLHKIIKAEKENFQSKVKFIKNNKTIKSYSYNFIIEAEEKLAKKRTIKSAVKLSFYRLLKSHYKSNFPWGCLTGIRPTKMLRELEIRQGENNAKTRMLNILDVSKDKYSLAKNIIDRQSGIISNIDDKSMDIYIGIPFCPSICHYCSFSSKRTESGDKTQAIYLDALKAEIGALKSIIARHEVRSIYIGGGTPTSFDLLILEQLLKFIKTSVPKALEYTVEAGRPDTLSDISLSLLKKYEVDRISINPQTLKQDTLDKVGRKHTIEQFFNSFKKARDFGFNNINIDLIFGLPGESLIDMKKSLESVIKLDPESITIHTLSIKNAAVFTREMKYKANEKKILKAVEMGRAKCEANGLYPYYMYRQKYMKGNLENVGYSKKGFESIYNIDMMEEVSSVMAFGAGAISKRVFREENKINRSANVKDLETYLKRYMEMVEKKKKLFE